MEKIKLLIILSIGLFTFIYNIINNNFISLVKETEIVVFLQGQISTTTQDSYGGALLDYLIGILFNINIKDIGSYFRIFGG